MGKEKYRTIAVTPEIKDKLERIVGICGRKRYDVISLALDEYEKKILSKSTIKHKKA